MGILLALTYVIYRLCKERYDIHKADEYARTHAKKN